MRHKTGNGPKSKSASEHPAESVLLDKLPLFFKCRRPLGVIIEEVSNIIKPCGPNGESPLSVVVAKLRLQYDGVAVVTVDSGIWSKVQRERLAILFHNSSH